jgi:hypothetical protein
MNKTPWEQVIGTLIFGFFFWFFSFSDTGKNLLASFLSRQNAPQSASVSTPQAVPVSTTPAPIPPPAWLIRSTSTPPPKDQSKEQLKALQPTIKELIPVVDAYVALVKSGSDRAKDLISNLREQANSDESKQAYANNPEETQEATNHLCSNSYDIFRNNILRDSLELCEDKGLFKTVDDIRGELRAQPDSSAKAALLQVAQICDDAKGVYQTYQSRYRTELGEKVSQINSFPADVDPVSDELVKEAQLLRSLDAAIDQQ